MTTAMMADDKKTGGVSDEDRPGGERASKAKPGEPKSVGKTRFDCPPEGPHARADLTNEDATPGTGLFSGGQKSADKEVDPGAG